MSDLVACLYPRREDYDELPEQFEEWRTADLCRHQHCQEGDYYARLYAAQTKPLTREEKEMIESDHELMADEFHGRDLDGRLRW